METSGEKWRPSPNPLPAGEGKGEGKSLEKPVTVSGRVLYLSPRAVKLWTPVATVWIPYSQIPPEDLAALKEGEDAQLKIPCWLAVLKGLVE